MDSWVERSNLVVRPGDVSADRSVSKAALVSEAVRDPELEVVDGGED